MTVLNEATSIKLGVKDVVKVYAGGTAVWPPALPGTVPDAPVYVSRVAGNQQVTVSFNPPASDGGQPITQYTVTSSPGNLTASGAGSPLTVTGLTNGTSYTFTVTATNVHGTSAPSGNSLPATPATVPNAPTIGTATAGNTQATIAFTPPAVNGGSPVTNYTVTSTPGGLTGTGTSSPITVTGLTNGTAYTFTVRASNVMGDSPESAASNSVTPAVPAAVSYIAKEFAGGGLIPVPAAAQAGDLLLLAVTSNSANNTVPSGFTFVVNENNGSSNYSMNLHRRVMQAGDSAFSYSTTSGGMATLYVFRGLTGTVLNSTGSVYASAGPIQRTGSPAAGALRIAVAMQDGVNNTSSLFGEVTSSTETIDNSGNFRHRMVYDIGATGRAAVTFTNDIVTNTNGALALTTAGFD